MEGHGVEEKAACHRDDDAPVYFLSPHFSSHFRPPRYLTL